jgi:hypothetical protein
MLSPSQLSLMTIRTAEAADQPSLRDLASLDSARPLSGTALVAEVDGAPIAALEMKSGRAVADPFRPTARVLELLRLRAAQLR